MRRTRSRESTEKAWNMSRTGKVGQHLGNSVQSSARGLGSYRLIIRGAEALTLLQSASPVHA
jgi:hypothetical protein